jgi:SAM-dependent methyltransferase
MLKILDIGSGSQPKLSSDYLEIEVTHADKREFVNIDHQDMEKLSYPDDSFDIVVCINALDHTKDARCAIANMKRVSKGMVYIDCALVQRSQSGGHHYWDALEDGTFKSKDDEFNIKDYGFTIELEDNGGERRYNHVVCRYTK